MAINIDELYLYSDNAARQNKNHSIVYFLISLVDTGHLTKVVYKLPMHGYLFLPNNRDFGIVKRRLNKVDQYYSVEDVMEIIANANHKFCVRLVKTEAILDFQTWCPTVYKKFPISEESQVGRLRTAKTGKKVVGLRMAFLTIIREQFHV